MKLLMIFTFLVSTAFADTELQTVPKVELNSYMGKWYEIARYKNWFQRKCAATTAEYELLEKRVRVTNSCKLKKDESKIDQAHGSALVTNKETNAKLKVSFVPFFQRYGWFSGPYWIIELGENYEYAVVGHPKRTYLWILSRTPTMSPDLYDTLLERLEKKHHYDTSKLIKTPTW